jgi:hypothetical protein
VNRVQVTQKEGPEFDPGRPLFFFPLLPYFVFEGRKRVLFACALHLEAKAVRGATASYMTMHIWRSMQKD